jgi:prepilin-type processing-associated H-X9-DG protein
VRGLAKAFTLVELLVILAIISLLAAITFPVFSSAKAAAHRTVCLSNIRQIGMAVSMYTDDYDSLFMLANQNPAVESNSRNDRTWVQQALPYTKSFSIFHCPRDFSEKPRAESTFDQDLVPGDTDSRYYTASMRTNYGLNYQYLSPLIWSRDRWVPSPRPFGQVKNPADTMMLIDSVWTRTADGTAYGGGHYLVTPPCRYRKSPYGNRMDSFNLYSLDETRVFTTSYGWNVADGKAPNVHGNAWPWHRGRMNMAMVDGHVRTVSPEQLTAGCELEDEWRGYITDVDRYIWDTF